MPAVSNTVTRPAAGTLCSGAAVVSGTEGTTPEYVYNDGDASSCYDVTYPIQMHGFDPNFHFIGMTFNPEMFVDMKDKYFLLNGRSYPDTVAPGPQATVTTDGQMHYSQPLPAIINIPAGGKASLRLANLSVAEYFTLAVAGRSHARGRIQRQAVAGPGRQQHRVLHQLDHAGRRRIARRDSGCQ